MPVGRNWHVILFYISKVRLPSISVDATADTTGMNKVETIRIKGKGTIDVVELEGKVLTPAVRDV